MRERFSSELKAAMKAGEKRRVDTIRMIMAALKNTERSRQNMRDGWILEKRARS